MNTSPKSVLIRVNTCSNPLLIQVCEQCVNVQTQTLAGGARAPGQGDAAIAAAKPRWLPRRAFGATAPPLTEGTGGARRPRARAAPGAPVCSPRRGTYAHGRRRPLTASAARVGHRSPVAMHPYPMCAYHARLCTQANQLRRSRLAR